MHRSLTAHVLGCLILLGFGRDALARDVIRLPLSCETLAGRAVVRPAAPRVYEIASAREKLPFTACAPGDPNHCRSITLHRFEVACGADRVPWIELASVLIADQGGRAWINQGRLYIARAGQGPAGKGDDCGTALTGRDGGLPGSGCVRGPRPKNDAAAWALPAGFAPLSELGVTLVTSPSVAESAAASAIPAGAPAVLSVPSMGLGADAVGAVKREALNTGARAPEVRPKQIEAKREPQAVAAPAPVLQPAALEAAQMQSAGSSAAPEVPPPPAVSNAAAVSAQPSHDAAPPAAAPSPPVQLAVLVPASAGSASSEPRWSAVTESDGSPLIEATPPVAPEREVMVAEASPTPETTRVGSATPPQEQEEPVLRIVSGSGWSPSLTLEEPKWFPPIAPAAIVDLVVSRFRELKLRQEFTVVMAVALVSGLLTGVGWFASRSWRVSPVRLTPAERFAVVLRPSSTALVTADAQMCGELCTTAHNLLRQIDVTVEELNGVAPLRRVLQREMRHLQQFLTAVTSAAPAESDEWRRMRNRLQRIVKELMRLKEIVDGAQRSLSAPGVGQREPRDRHEAYEVLGVHADISPKILKKLVDALRSCWHPDLAKDESDRQLREERMKRINIAWDIINDRRQEA